jgi:SAM-dependent methyltransferase
MNVSANHPLYENDDYLLSCCYDYALTHQIREDLPFYTAMAQLLSDPILELGSGTGRILIPLARLGLRMTGLDVSEGMLEVCRAKLSLESSEVQANVTLVKQDLLSPSITGPFRLILAPFHLFQLLGDESHLRAVLTTLSEKVEEGGHLVFDLFNPGYRELSSLSQESSSGEEPVVLMPMGMHMVRRHRLWNHDPKKQSFQAEIEHEITLPNHQKKTLTQSFGMKYYTLEQMKHILTDSGWKFEKVFGDFNRKSYQKTTSPEMIFLVRKEG